MIDVIDAEKKAKEMVKLAKKNSQELLQKVADGLISAPPSFKNKGKWILPSESPLQVASTL